ncbi:FecR family protein [Albibacterium bauzanense]|uniref:FecR family protein n=1 Tax=Albibacterium bauzanense TaxID=653929 RepID=A0A4R1M318_9SPHI|nr:FecR domain-containing protein [Albibacterium bauzanense]TCK85847.1 FecR family protein [Albibacterium bauzanense]
MNDKRVLELLTRKIAEEISLEELEELKSLFEKNPDIVYYEQYLKEIWQEEDAMKLEVDIDSQYEEHRLRYGQRLKFNKSELVDSEENKETNRNPMYFKYAFAVGLFVVLGVLLFKWNPDLFSAKDNAIVNRIEIMTQKGVRKQLVLPDGTKVWLNADSKLSYDNLMNDSDMRSVNLEGEAFFDVVKDVNRPFYIVTKDISIKVLGTAFNVKAYPEENKTETTLLRGSIELVVNERPKEKFLLKPNEKLAVTKNKIVQEVEQGIISDSVYSEITLANNITLTIGSLSKVNVDNHEYIQETSWIDNKLVFKDETLEEIVPKLERWYDLDIEITDIKLKTYRYTGTITKENIDQVLTAMQLIKPFHFKIQNDDVTLY